MNKLLMIGIILLISGISAYYIVEKADHGIWIGALMGAGAILIITAAVKKFN